MQLNFDLLDAIYYFYYVIPDNIDLDQSAFSISNSTPDWKMVLATPGPRSLIVMSQDPCDGVHALERIKSLFDAQLKIKAQKRIVHGRFAVYVWVMDIEDEGHLVQ